MPALETPNRRVGILWGLLALQSLCAVFLVYDALSDRFASIRPLPFGETPTLESLIVSALVFGLIFTANEIRRILGRQKRMEQQLQAASGAFSELLEEHFDLWSLTPSEREVALLSIKGLSIADMARVRNTKEGTIKAQCNAIYRKADVSSRTQLLSLFIEELLSDDVPLSERSGGPPDA